MILNISFEIFFRVKPVQFLNSAVYIYHPESCIIMLEVHNINVRYGKSRKQVLNDVSISMDSEKVAIVGPNGSGKTTLLKAVAGLTDINSGKISIFGKDLSAIRNELRISTNLPEVYRLMRMNTADTVRLYSELKGRDSKEILDLIEDMDLSDTLDKMLYELSTGQQKMICNLLSLSGSSKLILLDEPFESIDLRRRMKLTDLIINHNAEIVMNTHEFDILTRLKGWGLYFIIEGRLFGKFEASEVKNLYINRGVAPNHISVMETGFGTFSITRNDGEISISAARNFNSLLNEVT